MAATDSPGDAFSIDLEQLVLADEPAIRPGSFLVVLAPVELREVVAPRRVAVLGPPVVAAVIFEVLLNATAMSNHGEVRLPAGVDRMLRGFVVTPDMHRVHHSGEDDETNSSFGFDLPWCDRPFGTCREQPRARAMTR
jgi:hypothetical protein